MVIEMRKVFYKLTFEDARSVASFQEFKGILLAAEMA
jgi:hypothetical protein